MVNIFIVITIIITIITTIIHLIQWPTMAQSPFPPCFDFGLFCPRLQVLDWIGSYHNITIHLITIITHYSVVLLFKLIVMHNCLIVVAIWFPREVSIRSLTPLEGVGDCSIWFGGFSQVCLVRFGLVWLCQVCFVLVWSGKLQGTWCIVVVGH